MEIKHTIEILTKDIQDIENLVRNLQNSPKPAGIELDLALSKLRNVYEVLLLIKQDTLIPETAPSAEPPTKHVEDEIPVKPPKVQETEPAKSEEDSFEIEDQETVQQLIVEQPADTEAEEPPKQKKEAEILAEKFDQEASLNEDMATRRSGDVTSKISSQPIESISRHIGINDRFYIIRELFNGDADSYNNLVGKLDNSGNFNDAFQHIEKSFPDQIENEGVQILVNLARRRFITGGNV